MAQKTILIVEDDPDLLDLLRELLEMQNHKILSAPSGGDALNVWKNHSSEIDLVLADLTLPDNMTGVELGKKLLAEKADLKIIYSSGHPRELAASTYGLPSEANFLKKPFNADFLWATIQTTLAS